MYRIVGLAARRAHLLDSTPDDAAIGHLATQLNIQFLGDRVVLNGEDISEAIRTEQGGMDASTVSALPSVRAALVKVQRQFRRLPGLVADGRDMGTSIFAQAPLKVFLTASAQQRAQRRHKQLIAKGIDARIEDLYADLQTRDARDMSRAASPLQAAQDAQLLDNSSLDVPTSIAMVLDWWERKQPFAHH